MQFHNMTEFFHMGGYAAYVWPAFGIVALVLIGNLWRALYVKRQLITKLRKKYETR